MSTRGTVSAPGAALRARQPPRQRRCAPGTGHHPPADSSSGRASSPASGVPDRLSGLTERELESPRLVARGRSNAEIAAELFLAEITIKIDLSDLLTKHQGLRDRIPAVVLALRDRPRPAGAPHHTRPVNKAGTCTPHSWNHMSSDITKSVRHPECPGARFPTDMRWAY